MTWRGCQCFAHTLSFNSSITCAMERCMSSAFLSARCVMSCPTVDISGGNGTLISPSQTESIQYSNNNRSHLCSSSVHPPALFRNSNTECDQCQPGGSRVGGGSPRPETGGENNSLQSRLRGPSPGQSLPLEAAEYRSHQRCFEDVGAGT